MRKFGEFGAKVEFSTKYCIAVAEKAMKSLVFMHHEVMSTFLGSKNVLN